MKIDTIQFQQKAIKALRDEIDLAATEHSKTGKAQVISYSAPTGAGKTIIMASLMERVFCGDENYPAQPDAIFVWLSDSPELNRQSRDKIAVYAGCVQLGQTEMIEEESFNRETLDDGVVYFLNTQKLGKGALLTKHSDFRQYTIWETLYNTVEKKGDRLYFIIDEAHRGMKERKAAEAASIMQKFLKGSPDEGLPIMPVIIGITATPERFRRLAGSLGSTTMRSVETTTDEVRSSGLLKDRIILEYPETLNNEMAILQAATDEWQDKVKHWEQYCFEQHYAYVNPIFAVQVQNGSHKNLSDTDLDECLKKIEERAGCKFKKGEVVHAFGQTSSTLTINGLEVIYEEPSRISDNKNIKVVFFKESLSTGWDCPRAETMMSFRRASDSTYIAQLLGRMVRTPMRMHIQVDETLNDVRLFLPYFDSDTVKQVISELQSSDSGAIPAEVMGQAIGHKKLDVLSTKGRSKIIMRANSLQEPPQIPDNEEFMPSKNDMPDKEFSPEDNYSGDATKIVGGAKADSRQVTEVSRDEVIAAVNKMGLLTFDIRNVKINNYLKSLYALGRLLRDTLEPTAHDKIMDALVEIIHSYISELKKEGQYENLVQKAVSFKMNTQTIDVYGNSLIESALGDVYSTTDTDIDRQFALAEARLGSEGLATLYLSRYYDKHDILSCKIDIILFTNDGDCMLQIEEYAKEEFHKLADKYRLKALNLEGRYRRKYDEIVSNGDEISEHNFQLPDTITAFRDKAEGKCYTNHLYLNEDGEAWIKLNSWEDGVIKEEEARPDFVCWIRNIPRAAWALTIPYKTNGATKSAYPDFIVIAKDEKGGYIVNILEPHDPSRSDNLPKAQGFAEYAAKNHQVGRLELIRAVKDITGSRFRRLDLTQSLVREAVIKAATDNELNHIFDKYAKYCDE